MSDITPLSSSKNSLSSDVEIKGTVTFRDDLIFDGKLEGEIYSGGSLTVGQNASVDGEITSKSVIVRGKVEGNVTVEDRCELLGNAVVNGDVKAARLVVGENVTLTGRCEVTPSSSTKEKAVIRPLEFIKQAVSGGR